MRSLLFVPADSPRKIARALACDADALIVDLEDAVGEERKSPARAALTELPRDARRQSIYVRINALDTPHWPEDLVAAASARPAGIVLPKWRRAADLETLHAALAAAESRVGLAPGALAVIAIVTETAEGVLNLRRESLAHPRLAGLMWGAEDLATALGASSNRDASGAYTEPFRLARHLCLLAAAACSVRAIDAVFTRLDDAAALDAECRAARRDGFCSKAAIHPDQIATINAALAPSSAELEWARRVTEAFAAAASAGVVTLDGRMLDRPHLLRAQRLLASDRTTSPHGERP